jgi:hypothetical protein
VDDWGKAVLSAGLGFIGGLLAEPIRYGLSKRLKRNEVHRALHFQLLDTLGSIDFLRRTVQKNDPLPPPYGSYAETPLYDHYFATEKSVFYTIPDIGLYVRVFTGLKQAAAEADPLPALFDWADTCVGFVNAGRFRDRRLKKLASKIASRRANDG